jgi:type IV pilus assembly protein PilM
MNLLPTSLGTRPRLAVELRPEGVVAARSEDAQALLSAVSHAVWAEGTVAPGLKAGNIGARAQAVAAVKKTLEAVALKERQTTLVVPDAAMRVLLLDFDTLPGKAAEALPIVRFRLKKLLPFDADDAVVSYQIMSQSRQTVRVLAVAVPRDVLAEYETIVREAGFEPGAVLPSTLAACAGLPEIDAATLLVNAGVTGVTTAIVQAGVLLLHRTDDLAAEGLGEALAAAAVEPQHPSLTIPVELLALPLVDADSTAGEWAMQQPLSGYGVLDDDHISAEAAMQAQRLAEEIAAEVEAEAQARHEQAPHAATPPERAKVVAPGISAPDISAPEISAPAMTAAAREVVQAVSVAAAYFEDTLDSVPGLVLSAGTLGAETLGELLRDAGFADGEMHVREMVESVMLTGGATTAQVPKGWMAGVRGALRS